LERLERIRGLGSGETAETRLERNTLKGLGLPKLNIWRGVKISKGTWRGNEIDEGPGTPQQSWNQPHTHTHLLKSKFAQCAMTPFPRLDADAASFGKPLLKGVQVERQTYFPKTKTNS
jgi:hypothetical protein